MIRIFCFFCRLMFVHHMTLVSFRQLRKKLDNLREFLGKWFDPPIPTKNCPYAHAIFSWKTRKSHGKGHGKSWNVKSLKVYENTKGAYHLLEPTGPKELVLICANGKLKAGPCNYITHTILAWNTLIKSLRKQHGGFSYETLSHSANTSSRLSLARGGGYSVFE